MTLVPRVRVAPAAVIGIRLACRTLMALGVWLVLLSTLRFADAAEAAEAEYRVLRCSPLVIDGRLGERAWHRADTISQFVFPWHAEGKAEQTRARLLWDDQFLYLAFECEDAYIWAEHVERDSPVYQDDCVELFTAPDPQSPEAYFNFEMNVRAGLLDQHHPQGRYSGLETPWDSRGVRIATRWTGTVNQDDDADRGWTLEAAIPWDNFRSASVSLPPLPGDVWRANLNRCGGQTNAQYSQWISSGTPRPDFHVPEAFGRLRFDASYASLPASASNKGCCIAPRRRLFRAGR